MKAVLIFSFSLVGIGLIAAADKEKDIIRDKSPDGKFALRATKDEQGFWAADIVDLKSKDSVVSLDLYQNMIEGARLVWSKDSQWVAYFEPDRRGGSTTVYFRKESNFEVVELPESSAFGRL